MKKVLAIAFSFMTTFLSAQVNYTYGDGNANTYTINEKLITYEGVVKENSSSGVYDGGKSKSKALSGADFEKIEKLFNEVFAAKSEQQDERSMMTGLLIHKKGKKTIHQVVIKPNSPYIGKIEALLKSLL